MYIVFVLSVCMPVCMFNICHSFELLEISASYLACILHQCSPFKWQQSHWLCNFDYDLYAKNRDIALEKHYSPNNNKQILLYWNAWLDTFTIVTWNTHFLVRSADTTLFCVIQTWFFSALKRNSAIQNVGFRSILLRSAFSVKFVSVFGFVLYNAEDVSYYQASWEQHLTKKLHRDNVKIDSAKYSLFGISIRKCLDLLLKYQWSKMEVVTEEIRTAEWDNNCSTKL